MPGVLSRRYWSDWTARRLAAMPDRRGIKFLLGLEHRLGKFTLGVVKMTEGGLHPKHRLSALHDFFLDHVLPTDRVLDIGCAYGQIANSLAAKARHVTGVDIRAAAIARARQSFQRPNLEFRVGDFSAFTTGETFDVVVLSNVLEHIADRQAFLTKCRRLAPRILVRVPAIDRDWLVPYRRELGLEWRLHPDHEMEYTEDTLRDELQAAGFCVKGCVSRYGALHCVAVRA